MTEQIKTLAEAMERRKEFPYMYLVAIIIRGGGEGSFVSCHKEPTPLWKVYFMLNEANLKGNVYTITNIVDLNR